QIRAPRRPVACLRPGGGYRHRAGGAMTGDGPALTLAGRAVAVPDRADGVNSVGVRRALVGSVPQDAGEPQRDAAWVAAACLGPVERDFRHQLGADAGDAVLLAPLDLGPRRAWRIRELEQPGSLPGQHLVSQPLECLA